MSLDHPHSVPTIFGALNARYLKPHQVAQSFVPPPRFQQLCQRGHTLLIGPRGSGKTTLLRMLDGAALEAWDHERAGEYRAMIDYTGVFVPTDRTWSRQLEGLGEGLSDDHRSLLGTAAFTTHMLRALVAAMEHRAHGPLPASGEGHRRVALSPEQEEEMCTAAASTWRIGEPVGSLAGLVAALEDRMSDLDVVAQDERLRGEEGRGQRLADLGYLGLQFVSASMIIIERFDHAVEEPSGTWAFLIDEFELAAPSIREQILGSLRGARERLLFKISMAPYAEQGTVVPAHDSPTPVNDFETLPLTWPRKSAEEMAFAQDLFAAEAARRGLDIEPVGLLGRSSFETEPDEHAEVGTAYTRDSRLGRRLRELAEADDTFAGYLRSREIDLGRLDEVSGDDRAADVRKIAPLAAVRLEYRSSQERAAATGALERTRKNPVLYCGATTVFELTEGNPRWFIAIIGRLMDHYREQGSLPDAAQASEIRDMSNLFRSVLRSIPARHEGAPTVLSVLDKIGTYIHEQVVRNDFNPDPPGSFIITRRTRNELLEPLRLALNAGAILHVPAPGENPQVLSDLTGKRFRLAYLLAPHYAIPVRLGRPVEVSTVHGMPRAPDNQLALDFSEPGTTTGEEDAE
jgi:energy-coupling factor transporter ATP-binding protein EcfA2